MYPQVLGSGIAGTVVEAGPDVERLKVGDKVFGFTWRSRKEKAHQELVTVPEHLLGIIPTNTTPQAAVTIPNNLVTVFHALTTDLALPLPSPSSPLSPYLPPHASSPILIWGDSSSVGQYALQILHYYNYINLLATSCPSHYALLKSYGAKHVFDYRSPSVLQEILEASAGRVDFVLDCIGSKYGSLVSIAKIAGKGTKVAVLLPVVVRDASETESPEYEMDAEKGVEWKDRVEVRGVRTHFYLVNELFREKLQSEIMPALLELGIVKPNQYRIIEGGTLLERAQAAMDALRRKEVSGERLVWRVSERPE